MQGRGVLRTGHDHHVGLGNGGDLYWPHAVYRQIDHVPGGHRSLHRAQSRFGAGEEDALGSEAGRVFSGDGRRIRTITDEGDIRTVLSQFFGGATADGIASGHVQVTTTTHEIAHGVPRGEEDPVEVRWHRERYRFGGQQLLTTDRDPVREERTREHSFRFVFAGDEHTQRARRPPQAVDRLARQHVRITADQVDAYRHRLLGPRT